MHEFKRRSTVSFSNANTITLSSEAATLETHMRTYTHLHRFSSISTSVFTLKHNNLEANFYFPISFLRLMCMHLTFASLNIYFYCLYKSLNKKKRTFQS